ncbi:MAG: MBL fold metallo-hydrolase [Bdellovibrionota bacterium]
MNKITLLGSGTSTGVPILGCKCHVCRSTDVRNKRLRASALIETDAGKKILIDVPPDIRTQLLRADISSLDAVIVTHDHADHTHGMDDLRPFGFLTGKPIPVYSAPDAANDLRRKFKYIFERDSYFKDKAVLGGGIPLLDLHEVGPGSHEFAGENFELLPMPHGHEDTYAVIHGKCAYVVDCREIPEKISDRLRDAQLEVLVIDCLRMTKHSTHLHLELSLEYIRKIAPKLAILTHMGHELEHGELLSELKARGAKNVVIGTDGATFFYS